MELKQNQKIVASDEVKELAQQLLPKLTPATQFILNHEDAAFGPTAKDENLTVWVNDAVSAKTTQFETDGTWKDGMPFRFGDGDTKARTVTGWNWAIVENVVKGADGKTRVAQTCYVKDRVLLRELRAGLGLL